MSDSPDQPYEFRDPVYNASGTIDCEVNHPTRGWIPITIDPTEYPDLWATVTAGPVGPYVPDPAVAERLVKSQMNYLMKRWVIKYAGNVLEWADLTPPKKAQVSLYRTQLLNIVHQPGYPFTVNWPDPPNV